MIDDVFRDFVRAAGGRPAIPNEMDRARAARPYNGLEDSGE
jgi:hypothetical protein